MIKPNYDYVYSHIKENKYKYIITILFLFSGIICGAIICSNSLNSENDIQYLNNFISAFNLHGADFKNIFLKSLTSNMRLIFILWLSGWFVFLMPLNVFEIFAKGFGIGYSVSYISTVGGLKGLGLSISAMLLQNIILIPALIVYSVIQMTFSIRYHFVKRTPNQYKQKNKIIKNNLCILSIFILISILCSAVEAYISPLFMQPICNYF